MHDVAFCIEPSAATFEQAAELPALPAEGIGRVGAHFAVVRHTDCLASSEPRGKTVRLRIVTAAEIATFHIALVAVRGDAVCKN